MDNAHIIHVFPSASWGGAEIYSVELAARQMQKGLRVTFWGVKDSRIISEAKARGLNIVDEPLSWRLDLLSLPRLAKKLRDLKATHLHIHWSGGVWAFFGIKLLYPVKIFYHVHLWMKHTKKDPFHLLAYQMVDRLIVAGPSAKEAILKTLPISAKKIRICPYGMDFTKFENVVCEITDTPEVGLVFGIFARIDRQKGIKEFLLAMEPLMKRHAGTHLVVVGDPTHGEAEADSYFQEIKELLKTKFDQKRIHQFGFQKNYLNLLACCQVLVAPSFHESYSLIILDAFALGIPVLSTRAGGTPDLVTDERGWLVPPQDVDALRIALNGILSDPHDVTWKSECARTYVTTHHSFENVLKKISAIYEE